MPAKAILFRSNSLAEQLKLRSNNLGGKAAQDLDRYYQLLKKGLKTIHFTEEELLAICDALNAAKIYFDISVARSLFRAIEGAISYEKLDKQWNIDSQEILDKVERLSDLEAAAIIDSAERFWCDCRPLEVKKSEINIYFEK